MIIVDMPGYGNLKIKNLVLDYNGTLATSGFVFEGVREIINELAKKINIFVVTANTFGNVDSELMNFPIEIIKIKSSDERKEKLDLIKKLGTKVTVSIGNGNNDAFMLKESIVGICIIGQEGCSREALDSSDLAIGNIKNALELLISADKLKAMLRF